MNHPIHILTPEQKDFINDHYKTLSKPKLAKKMGIDVYPVEVYMKAKKLKRELKKRKAKVVAMEGYFDDRILSGIGAYYRW